MSLSDSSKTTVARPPTVPPCPTRPPVTDTSTSTTSPTSRPSSRWATSARRGTCARTSAPRASMTLYRMNEGRRGGFGHRHDRAEEMYVVLSGSGRVKIDDDILDLRPLDVVRVAPASVREFDAGPDGMHLLAF